MKKSPKPGLLRPLRFKTKANRYAEGSCLVEMGHTRVLCLASVEEAVPPWREAQGLGWVTAEYAMVPRATHTRTPRESVKGKLSGRTQEISRLVGRALRSVVDFKKLGPRTVTVDCEVLQADGGTRCAAINGGFIALAEACERLRKQGMIREWPLRGQVAGLSVGIVAGKVCSDLNYEQDSGAEVDMNVVMTSEGHFVEIQGTAEGRPFSQAQADQLLRRARQGIKNILQKQKKYCPGIS